MLAKQQVIRARGNADIGVLVVHALWTRIIAKAAKKPGVLRNNVWVLWSMALHGARNEDKQRSNNHKIIILAFYFSDPVPLFLVRDHFSCKYVYRE